MKKFVNMMTEAELYEAWLPWCEVIMFGEFLCLYSKEFSINVDGEPKKVESVSPSGTYHYV